MKYNGKEYTVRDANEVLRTSNGFERQGLPYKSIRDATKKVIPFEEKSGKIKNDIKYLQVEELLDNGIKLVEALEICGLGERAYYNRKKRANQQTERTTQ